MRSDSPNAIDVTTLKEVEQFLFHEAELLDERQFDSWLDILADDIQYSMPILSNVSFDNRGQEITRPGRDICWFDDDKAALAQRVRQINTGEHWAEEPASRVCRLITNILITAKSSSSITVRDRFLIYQNRLETDTTIFVGKRESVLRGIGGDQAQIASRTIWLSQGVLLAKNLSIFF
ncbi:MAG: 3-phenylpropionate/cinnamic acid dioxygenase subunit beta [Candidatus Binataceae bacterium]|nr:3-phenylpropionate/cinnamic acid dioxygenase subunit beta [Candidatus Binataceae bacterium]